MVRSLAYFALMSVIWGLTWAAMKLGLRDLPPLLLAAVFWNRFSGEGTASGVGLLAIVVATASYSVGSVVARPLVGPVTPLADLGAGFHRRRCAPHPLAGAGADHRQGARVASRVTGT